MLDIFLWIFAIYGIYRLISDIRKENTYDKFDKMYDFDIVIDTNNNNRYKKENNT